MGKAPYYYSENVRIYEAYGMGDVPYLQVEIMNNDNSPIFVFSDRTSATAREYSRKMLGMLMTEDNYMDIFVYIGDMVEFLQQVKNAFIEFVNDLVERYWKED